MKRCIHCGAQITEDSRFCSECGKEIPQDSVCPHCGASVGESDAFCQNCGKRLNESRNSEPITYEEEQPYSGFKKYLPYIIGAFVLLGIIGYFSSKDSSNQNNSTNAVVADSTSTEIEASVGQLAKEQITKRLKEIFDDVVKGRAQDCDERFFSSDFKRIYKEVEDIDERYNQGGVGFWDSGFWDMSQDNIGMSIVVNDVYDIKDNEAIANVTFSIKYYGGTTEPHNEDIKVILEDGKWVLDDLHGYKKQMKEYIEGIKKTSPAPIESSTNISPTRTFTSEQMVVGYLANQTFRSSDGFTIRFDGSGRMYAEGDFAGVVSVLHYNSTSAMLRYGGGQYTEGKFSVQIVGDKLQLSDPVDGTVYYQR